MTALALERYCDALQWPEFLFVAVVAFTLGYLLGRWDRNRSRRSYP